MAKVGTSEVMLMHWLRQPLPGTRFLTQRNSLEGDTPLTSLDVMCLLFGDNRHDNGRSLQYVSPRSWVAAGRRNMGQLDDANARLLRREGSTSAGVMSTIQLV